MVEKISGKSVAAWKDVASLTVLGTLISLAVSIGINYLLLFNDTLTPFEHSLISAVLLPVILCLPLFAYIGFKQVEIRRYRRELNRSATYDNLTGCLNGAVFTSMVDRRAAGKSGSGPRSGAFLVIHPEHLHAINVRFGLGWGDEALRLVASTIKASVRSGDIVGRIGASMFGAFLPGASEENAKDIGERIRANVARVYFAPQGTEDMLRVSVGGVIFEGDQEFEEMFRSAEEHLSGLKGGLELSHLPDQIAT